MAGRDGLRGECVDAPGRAEKSKTTRRIHWGRVVALSVLISLAGFAYITVFSVASSPPASQHSANAPSGMVVRLFKPFHEFAGTGCVVGHRGGRTFILTAFHVGASESNFGKLRLEAVDFQADLAIVSIPGEFGIAWTIGDTPSVGEDITCLGFFEGIRALTRGYVSNAEHGWIGCSVGPGMSGGAVVGSGGRLVGIIRGTWVPIDMGVFIHSSDIRDLIGETGL